MTKEEHSYSIDDSQDEETLPSPSRPGILTVILREGAGLSVPDGFQESPDEERNNRNIPYAIMTFDKSQKKASSQGGNVQNPIWNSDTGPLHWNVDHGVKRRSSWDFDVCRPAELAIYLYLGDPRASSSIQGHAFLGVARIAIDPSKIVAASSQWIDVQDGTGQLTGQLRISLEYQNVEDRTLETADFRVDYINELNIHTWQLYTTRTVPMVQRLQNVNHPFLAPLTLTFKSQEDLNLLSPAINGGHLFHHLQRQHRFNLESAQFYAADSQ